MFKSIQSEQDIKEFLAQTRAIFPLSKIWKFCPTISA